jgi:hypothetical protein
MAMISIAGIWAAELVTKKAMRRPNTPFPWKKRDMLGNFFMVLYGLCIYIYG